MIYLYGNASPNLIKILFMLGESQLPYEIRYVNIMAGENFTPEYIAINPNAKIPSIIDDDVPGKQSVIVFESGAILIYLAEKTGRFYGRDAIERARIIQWLMLQMSGIGPMFGQATHFRENGPAPGNSSYARIRYFTEAVRLCEVLDSQLAKNTYLAGEEFSIADIATFPWIRRYPEQIGIDMSALPHLHRWRLAIEQRAGFQRITGTLNSLIERGLQEQKISNPDALDRFFRRGAWAKKPKNSAHLPGFGEIKP